MTRIALLVMFSALERNFDYVFWGFWVNAALVGATLIIAIFAVIQASAAKESARAAELNAKVLMEGQRPQIAAEAHGNPSKDLADRAAPRVQIELTNQGMTTAFDFTYESWIELLRSLSDDFTTSADYFKSPYKIALYPKHTPLTVNIPLHAGLTDAQLSDLRNLRLYCCIRIRVGYRDAFNPKRRYDTNFGFYVMLEGLGFLPKYNDSA